MTVTQLAMEQFPLGLFAAAAFHSGLVRIEKGDVLALLTDGLPETADAGDEQFGLERIGKIIARSPAAPLAELMETNFYRGSPARDPDGRQTLVLVRAVV